MGQAIGRIEILSDPLGLAQHVAEWMTQAALAAQGSFRVSLSGGWIDAEDTLRTSRVRRDH
jgi:hypothetical protein